MSLKDKFEFTYRYYLATSVSEEEFLKKYTKIIEKQLGW